MGGKACSYYLHLLAIRVFEIKFLKLTKIKDLISGVLFPPFVVFDMLFFSDFKPKQETNLLNWIRHY